MAKKLGAKPIYIPPGTMFGFLKVLKRVNTPPGASGGQRYRLECTAKTDGKTCGQNVTRPRFYLVRKNGPLTHCGCLTPKANEQETYTKRSWNMMHVRCEYEGHVAYHRYGGRGIEICERWHKSNPDGFANFIEDMGHRPFGLSLDRIDPDGHYEPIHRDTGKPQCRWASKKVQSRNQSRYKDKEWDDD